MSTSPNNMAIAWILALLYFYQALVFVTAIGTFDLQLTRFVNEGGMDMAGGRCDRESDQQCDTVFKICLDRADRPEVDKRFEQSFCKYIYEETDEYANTDIVDFLNYTNADKHLKDTHQKIFHTSLPESVELRIQAYDDNSNRGSDDDIDKLYINLPWRMDDKPDFNKQLATWRNHSIVGVRDHGQPTTMEFLYKLYCNPTYYGATCGVSCVGKDDKYRHFMCDPATGHKICLPGYEDLSVDCRSKVDDCINNTCQHGSKCTDHHLRYTCHCTQGYTGDHCEIDVDDCASQPCHEGATCVDDVNSYTCNCDEEHTGENCQHHVCNVTAICQNGGTCYGSGKCRCPADFIGDKCEMDKCENITCGNNGTCLEGKCVCYHVYPSNVCENHLCDAEVVCFNGSTCSDGNCSCASGYKGKFCNVTVRECDSSPCHGNGTCRDVTNGYVCDCPQGVTGVNCENIFPDPAPTIGQEQTTASPREVTHTTDADENTVTSSRTFRTDNTSREQIVTTECTICTTKESVGRLLGATQDTTKVNHSVNMQHVIEDNNKLDFSLWGLTMLAAVGLLALFVFLVVTLLLKYKRREKDAEREFNDLQEAASRASKHFVNPLYSVDPHRHTTSQE